MIVIKFLTRFRKVNKIYYFSDLKIEERHNLLSTTIGTLNMENEAYEQAFYMAWAFYPCFFVIGLGQILFFYLYNRKYHPFSEILKGVKKQGKQLFFTLCVEKAAQT